MFLCYLINLNFTFFWLSFLEIILYLISIAVNGTKVVSGFLYAETTHSLTYDWHSVLMWQLYREVVAFGCNDVFREKLPLNCAWTS